MLGYSYNITDEFRHRSCDLLEDNSILTKLKEGLERNNNYYFALHLSTFILQFLNFYSINQPQAISPYHKVVDIHSIVLGGCKYALQNLLSNFRKPLPLLEQRL
jgi:hypothetical protein